MSSRWVAPTLALLLSMAVGCGAAAPPDPSEVDLEAAAELSLDEIAARVHPYALDGSTPEGLALLEGWLRVDPAAAGRAEGYRLRARALVDLWIFGQVGAELDPEASRRALSLVAARTGARPVPERFDAGALASLRQRLSAQVEADYARAGASESERTLALGLVAWDPTDPAGGPPPEEVVAAGDDPRSRLLLAGRLFHNDRSHTAQALAHPRLVDVAWLCDGERGEDVASLAARCGFWCAELPEQPAAAAPGVEHDVHELGGDDTPVEIDESPFEPEDYAAYLEVPEEDASPWFPTPGDVGYELVRACGAEYFGLPPEGGVVLLNERNYLDLVYLSFAADLLANLERELLRGEPLVVLSSNLLGAWSDHYLRDGLPQELTSAALSYDARLELPRWRAGDAGADLVADAGRFGDRLILLRSDAVTLAVAPRLTLDRVDGRYHLVWAEGETGYHYPGLEVVTFPRLNRLDDDQVSGDRIPILARDLEDLERLLAAAPGPGEPEEIERNACGGPAQALVSVLADGSTYFETLRPALKTILDCGYAGIELVTVEPTSGRPVPLRVSFVLESGGDAHQLQLENGRYAFRAWSEEPVAGEAFRGVERDETPLLTLYRHLAAGLDAGALDPGRPLQLTIADERVDAGVLAVVLQALLFRREGEPTTDADLLTAPLAVDAEGRPLLLFPAGIVVNLS